MSSSNLVISNGSKYSLPALPKSWDWLQLKRYCNSFADYGESISSDDFTDEGIRFIRTTDINSDGSLSDDGAVYVDPDQVEGSILSDGDILLSRSGTVGLPFCYDEERDGPCAYASYLVRFDIQEEYPPKYFEYYCRSAIFDYLLEVQSTESTISNVSGDKFAGFPVPAPGKSNMKDVIRFLDKNIPIIDEGIEKLNLLEQKINTREQSLISDLISGHETTSVKLKYISDMLPGYAFPSDGFSNDESGVKLLRGKNISPSGIRWDDTEYWPDHGEFTDYLLEPDDVVLAMDRPWIKSGMRVAQIGEEDCPSLLVQRVLRIRTNDRTLQSLIFLQLRSSRFRQYFDPILTGVSVPHISRSQVGDFEIEIPIEYETSQLINKWKNYNRLSNDILGHISDLRTRLQEKRQALITDAVTGQIAVTSQKSANN